MNIFKPSFENYLKNIFDKTNDSIVESILLEMPLKPIRFQGPSGEYEGDQHHVVSSLPIFMDWYDIYYLYQFPEKLWIDALSLRYTKILYEAKKNKNYEDIQDITLNNHGSTYVFKGRNTFGTQLVDKIERTVDVDHFMNAKDKTPENKQAYEDKFKANKDSKIDMGGYIGADMSEPTKTDLTGDLWASKGMMGPNAANIRQLVPRWVKASSHGLLGDTEEHGNTYHTFKPTGGPAAERDLLVLNIPKLKEISRKMSAAGAVPFVILANGNVTYKDVAVTNGTGSILKVRAGLPILLPGKAIDSTSNKEYESLHTQQKQINKISLSTIKDVDSYKRKVEEISKQISDGKFKGKPSALENAEFKMYQASAHVNFDKFLKEKGIDPKTINNDDLKDLKIEFDRHIYSKYKQLSKNLQSYDNYDWNFHKFNRDRNAHDPLQTGVENPFELGDFKHPRLNDKTARYGAYEANKQSKSMIHGEEGDWEKYFKNIFSVSGSSDMTSFKIKSALSAKEIQEIKREAEKYLRAVGRKLSSDSDVLSYLNLNPSNSTSVLSSFILLREALNQKGVLNRAKNLIADESAPKSLHKGFEELKNVYEKLNIIEEEMQTGFSKSDIQQGVESELKKTAITNLKVLKIILEANKNWIILNAENFVKRNLGETAFIKMKKILQNPESVSAMEKYKVLLDAKQEVRSLAEKYTNSISQLKFGSEDSETQQGIETRRNRAGKDNRSTTSMTSSKDDLDDMDFGVLDDEEGIDDAIDRGESPNTDTLSQSADSETGDRRVAGRWEDDVNSFVSAFFGDAGKSNVRKFRPNSDSTTHRIGHNVNTMYDLMQKEAVRASERAKKFTEINAKALELKNKSSITHQEMQMLRGINNSLQLYNFFVSIHEKKKLPGNAVEWAKDRMKNVLKRNKMTLANNLEDLSTSMRYAPADQSEIQAVTLYQRMEAEAEDEQDLSDKIVAMSKKVDLSPNPELAKHIVDRLRILNQESQIFNTYKMAASESDVVPNVKLDKTLTHKLDNVIKKHGVAPETQVTSTPPSSTGQSRTPLIDALRAKAAAAAAQQTVPQPQATPVPQPQNPTASEPPRSMSLADRLKAKREQK
jgi:hypothetical protein